MSHNDISDIERVYNMSFETTTNRKTYLQIFAVALFLLAMGTAYSLVAYHLDNEYNAPIETEKPYLELNTSTIKNYITVIKKTLPIIASDNSSSESDEYDGYVDDNFLF